MSSHFQNAENPLVLGGTFNAMRDQLNVQNVYHFQTYGRREPGMMGELPVPMVQTGLMEQVTSVPSQIKTSTNL